MSVRLVPIEERRAQMHEWIVSSQRQSDAIGAIVDAIPMGLTREELEAVAERFAFLVTTSGPRRGLCRFSR